MDDNSQDFCRDGSHYIFDGSSKNFVNVGPCEQNHEVEQTPEALQGAQMQQAGQSLWQKLTGQGAAATPTAVSPQDPVSKAVNKKLGVGDPKAAF